MSLDEAKLFYSMPVINLVSPIKTPPKKEEVVLMSLNWADPEKKLLEIEAESKEIKDDKLASLVKEINLDSEDQKIQTLNDRIYENFKKNHPSQNCTKTKYLPDLPTNNTKQKNRPKQICKFILVKGSNKGKQCTSIVAKNSHFCHAHNTSKSSPIKIKQPDNQTKCYIQKIEELENKQIKLEKKINFLLQKNMQLCVKAKKPIRFNKLNKKCSYIFKEILQSNIVLFEVEETKKQIKVKVPRKMMIEKKDEIKLKFNVAAKKFAWNN